MLNAKRADAYQELDTVVRGYYAADECVALAAADFRKDQRKGIQALSACGRVVKPVTDALPPAFKAAMKATSNPEPAGR